MNTRNGLGHHDTRIMNTADSYTSASKGTNEGRRTEMDEK